MLMKNKVCVLCTIYPTIGKCSLCGIPICENCATKCKECGKLICLNCSDSSNLCYECEL